MRIQIQVQPRASVEAVADGLTAIGATAVRPPRPELPGYLIAAFPEDARPGLLAEIERIPGVRRAEFDAPQQST